ncbi:EAL and HDOD domain-containing protein [Legionella hackeliae]|uniref:Diguanylate phosphodiesterase n=1 Tax=Legionella hackeliae TaxID=449 RepID=A0A0A8UK83_LEGHA|nr:HDOD domain-containing protein [Legionella hackeliae]KTD13434.1 putative Diguanylate phosphodiesterase (EAL domain) [Legionella hackeliae]CEK09275.1 Diguanylate phosphodiesterase [Legionella hackeliae]STX49182.1 putative signal transduction protein [Legionella hackeliae]
MVDIPIHTLLARQGIYNKQSEVCAYELLYRDDNRSVSNVEDSTIDGDRATSTVITQLFANLDLDAVIGDKLGFINFTYNHLIQQIPQILPQNRIVVEVLENVIIDEALISSLLSLSNMGYKIALDDFIFTEEILPLIEIADIIKIDVLGLDKSQIKSQLAPLTHFRGKLLAEKIEFKEQLNWCAELGFDYFQGFFLNKPDPLKGQVLTENKTNLLRLLNELNDEKVSINRVEEIILQIPKLSYRILQLANSVSYYQGRKMESLLDAINQLGLIQIRNWLCLLLLSSVDEVALDLLERTLIRAKMCETLAKTNYYPKPQMAYMVGVLSTLDAILNEPMGSLLNKIQLSDQLNTALLNHKGDLGQILKYTIAYEEAQFSALEASTLDISDFANSYLQGIRYARDVMALVK